MHPLKYNSQQSDIIMKIESWSIFETKIIHQSFATIFKMGAWKLTQPHSTLNAIVEVDNHMKDYGKSSLYQILVYSSLELAKATYKPNLSGFTNVRNHSRGLIVKTIIWNFFENRYIPIKKWQMTNDNQRQITMENSLSFDTQRSLSTLVVWLCRKNSTMQKHLWEK